MLRPQASSPPVLFRRKSARARRTPRGRQQSRETLPDWMWGGIIGVFVVLVAGGYFLVTNISGGGGGGTCGRALPPLGRSEVSEQTFRDEDAALGRVLALLGSGDVSGAESAFFGPTHNFTHNVDPPVRERNEALAKDLCQAVIDLEDALAFDTGAVKITFALQKVRDLLRDSAQTLGYSRPG